MKKILIATLLVSNVLFACKKTEADNNGTKPPTDVEKGIVKGQVLDTKGQPMAGVKIYVDNNIYFNSGISTVTNTDGYYRVAVPQGSWYVYAKHAVTYNGRVFNNLDLHPEVSTSFAGGDGAVRNFRWKLSGEKPVPLAGHYGGTINLYNDPNADLWDVENIEFTFTPARPLIDGHPGVAFTAKSGLPRTDNFKKIPDVPMGRYTVTAKHLPTGKTIKLGHNDGSGRFSVSVTVDFEPELNFCTRCLVIVYTDK